MKFRLISLFFTFISASVVAAELAPAPSYGAVKLRTTIWPPYQMMLQGELSGESTETLRCIFRDINESFSVQVMPWQRAIQDMKHSVADGIFTTGPSPELDEVATMSAPFALEKWYWYHASGLDLSDVKTLRIGAVRSSNQATWLDTEGIPVTELVNEGMQLVRLVQAGRIDTFIADSRYFEELVEEASASSDFESDLQRTFVRYMPLGVYFADQFLQQHPVGLKFLEPFQHPRQPRLDRIDVPGGDFHAPCLREQKARLKRAFFISHSRARGQMENDAPQPQLAVALGLEI
uniref:substrate-binding periplasmic protein n=1 Tax=uncultured Thalassolituus sp. TaxID=285273 RepID=UPI002608B133